jgi:hypothetical protein
MTNSAETTLVDLQTQCNEWIELIAYKPEWEIRVVHSDEKIGAEGLVLHLISHVADSCTDEHEMIEVVHRNEIPDSATFNFESFFAFVYEMILKAEEHEAAEWFLVNGKRIHDPHTTNIFI